MEECVDADWSVVTGRKEKKASPKVQNKKSLKRGELQRSSSSNQVNTRRKLAVTHNNNTPVKVNDSAKPLSLSQKNISTKVPTNGAETTDEGLAVANDTITDIIEDVSMSIKRLSIDNLQAADRVTDFKAIALRNNSGLATVDAQHSPILDSAAFCEKCRNFNPNPSGHVENFATRGLLNTGSTCFWNCVMQSLFAVEVFKRLLLELLAAQGAENGMLPTSLTCWREVLQLAAEFKAHSESSTNEVQGKVHTAPSYGAVTRSSKVSAVAATELMPSLYHTFQDKMDEISGISNHLRTTTIGTSDTGSADQRKRGARKNAQQDAVEFLTFLLDSLHEELVREEAHNSLVPSQYSSSEKLAESDRLTTRSPFLRNATPSMMSVDGDASGIDSRQNSTDMIIALSRQNSLSTDYAPPPAPAESADEGWSTVSKATSKAKVKAVVVDAESKKRATSAGNASVISRLFHGTLRSEVVYMVKKTNSVTFQQFHCLTLDVANVAGSAGSSGGTSVDACLSSYFAEELIDDGKVRKQLKLDTLPEVLILQLGRFSYDYYKGVPTKIQKCVEYPAVLNLPMAVLSEELQAHCAAAHRRTASASSSNGSTTSAPQYQLQAVVLHHGKKATGGHYSAITCEMARGTTAAPAADASRSVGMDASAAKNQNSKAAAKGSTQAQAHVQSHDLREKTVWRSINDAKMSVITEAQALSAQDTVYILFYGRKH